MLREPLVPNINELGGSVNKNKRTRSAVLSFVLVSATLQNATSLRTERFRLMHAAGAYPVCETSRDSLA